MTSTSDGGKEDYIDPVRVEDLARALREDEQAIDPGSRCLLEAEKTYIRKWRQHVRPEEEQAEDPQNLIGLALSGGGIRSATFSLGVMQALAHRGLLRRIDYLSTVSGGGYIGSALSWLLSDKASTDFPRPEAKEELGRQGFETAPEFGPDRDNFPFGTDDPAPGEARTASDAQQRMLKYLRQHGDYLAPGAGISILSLLGVILRGVVLNLLVWIPIFVLFFLGVLWVSGGLAGGEQNHPPILVSAISKLAPVIGCSAPADIVMTPPSAEVVCPQLKTKGVIAEIQQRLPELYFFELLILVGLTILVLLLVATVLYSILTKFRRGASDSSRERWYALRRAAETMFTVLLPLVLISLFVGTLPIVSAYLQGLLAATGPLAMLVGLVAIVQNFIRSSSGDSGAPAGVVVSVGSVLFLYGVFLVSYQLAFNVFPSPSLPTEVFQPTHMWFLGGLVALPAATGLLVNLNYISIHRFYRDRLMETFMPDIGDALLNRTGAAQSADDATLTEIANPTAPKTPYHIVNTNLVLVDSEVDVYKDRGGDSFVLSPLYCGSNATGWCKTAQFMDGEMTLATAVAISGAAANPDAGVGGAGLTRNVFLSLVMSLLNLKLGYWAIHPDPQRRPFHCPNHFSPGAYAFGNVLGTGGLGSNENNGFLQLSDGGHFENTGVYELVRRRAKLIIVCDGSADAEFSFSDFQTTVRRIEDDFGAQVKVAEEASPDELMPQKQHHGRYPRNTEFAKQGHMLGTITYADNSKGILIYLKTTLTIDVSFKVKGYAAQNPEFPDQSTADQFFDEVQFEAYRELGYRLADTMLSARVPRDIGDEDTLEGLIRAC